MNDGAIPEARDDSDRHGGSEPELPARADRAEPDRAEPRRDATSPEPAHGASANRLGDPMPGDSPPTSRRLERAPSERYRTIEYGQSGVATQSWRGSPARGVWGGVAAGLAGAAIFVVAAGGLSFDWGLVVLAVYIGWSVAETIKFGAGPSMTRAPRRNLAVVLALLALSAGEAGTWAWARSQGGNLPILEHLWATYGPLLVVQYLGAAAAAAWTAR